MANPDVLLPRPRGVCSEIVFEQLAATPQRDLSLVRTPTDVWSDDFQVLLWALQQMAFRRFDDVDPAWEQRPVMRNLRDRMETAFESELRRRVDWTRRENESAGDAVQRLIREADGPSLSAWMLEHGSAAQLREFVVHRAAYQLQEADPHSFAIGRLAPGRAKRALLKIQFDEYGNAEPGQSHAELFRDTMTALGASPNVDALPASTLRTNTLLNLLTNSRRLLGACVGHLAVFEMCSVEPMSRYAAAIRRVLPNDIAAKAARFYDVHVAADGWHEQLALDELVDGFAEQYPDETDEVVFGAAALMHVEQEFASTLLDAWQRDASSLRGVPRRTVRYLAPPAPRDELLPVPTVA